ncbi:MAG: hypothetical protein ACK6CE_04400 [Planctomycetota bacterium]|jgi:hypothetical protein
MVLNKLTFTGCGSVNGGVTPENFVMELRPELKPPVLDDKLVERLAELADKIDGARPGEWDEWRDEFNRLCSLRSELFATPPET